MRTSPPASSVVIGPSEHGVVRHALCIAAATTVHVVRHASPASFAAAPVRPTTPLTHWHFTDRLFGDHAGDAARWFETCTGLVPGRHLVSLHDIPVVTSGEHSARRVAAYRRVADSVDAIVVASHHEQERLHRGGIRTPSYVIPLPIHAPEPSCDRASERRTQPGPMLGVLGFVYPGKGHADVLRAAAELGPDVAVVALGRASDGHDAMIDELHRYAADVQRRFVLTGFVDDGSLGEALRRIDVPVMPARTTSASASVGTWIAGGRRPLVARNGYTAELAAHGDLVALYDPDDPAALVRSIRHALAQPSTTWRRSPVPTALTLESVAAAHRAVYDEIADGR